MTDITINDAHINEKAVEELKKSHLHPITNNSLTPTIVINGVGNLFCWLSASLSLEMLKTKQ
ncbi:MAG: hypothetical protein Kow0080_05340 [Candidatus Promineifilaceae bacterium]